MRFGPFVFTGKERDEETGYGYFGARYMDYSLLTSFISVDRYASKYPFISPYAYCAWNPIRLIDPTGDTLVAKDAASQRDIRAVADEYGNRILFDENGMASIDYSDMTDKEKKEMNKHIGVHLLKDIIESDKWFLYEASDITCVTTIEGNSICGTMYNDNNGVMNLSRYGRDSNRGYSYMPQNGFDGQVIIAISGSWKDHKGFNARNKIVSHELAENYARTHLKYDFHEGETQSAHIYAINRMKDLNYGSYTYEPHFNLVNLQLLCNEKRKKYLGF